MVLQFSAGVLEFTEIPFDLEDFHKNVLLDMQEPALAVAFYKAWLDAGSRAPQYLECIGYKRPLFLAERTGSRTSRRSTSMCTGPSPLH